MIESQNWTAYNTASCEEKRRFGVLLADLCRGIPQPEQAMGRPRLPLSDMTFACVFKVYCGFSSRRFTTDLRDAFVAGHIDSTPHFNSVSNYLAKPELTDILKSLITTSSLPLRAVETDFAVDSSGFATSSSLTPQAEIVKAVRKGILRDGSDGAHEDVTSAVPLRSRQHCSRIDVMDIPDWLWQNVVSEFFTKGLMLAAWLAWKYRGRLNEVYGYMLVLLAKIRASVTLAHHQGELARATDNSAELEDLREGIRNLTQKIDPFAQIRRSIKDGLKVPIPTAQYIPHKVRYVPPRMSHQPMQIRYRSPKIGFTDGLPHVVPAGVVYEPPRIKVTPPSLDFVPGGVRLVMRTT